MGLNFYLLGDFRGAVRSFERVLQLYGPNKHGTLTTVAAYDTAEGKRSPGAESQRWGPPRVGAGARNVPPIWSQAAGSALA
jgi:hypothetical protein